MKTLFPPRIPQPAFRCLACNALNNYSAADICMSCGRDTAQREEIFSDRVMIFGDGWYGRKRYIQNLCREYYYKFI